MCGRYSLAVDEFRELHIRFDIESIVTSVVKPETDDGTIESVRPLLPRYNIAPTQRVPIVCARDGVRTLVTMTWGLVPSWSKTPTVAFNTINARAETVATKPVYRTAFRKRRCLVPATGFFEWQARRSTDDPSSPRPPTQAVKARMAPKQPFLIRPARGGLWAFAGLWEGWGEGSDRFESFSIVTTTANEKIAPVHDRMPVILADEHYGRWLSPESDPRSLTDLLVPIEPERVEVVPVTARVNRATFDDPSVLIPLPWPNS